MGDILGAGYGLGGGSDALLEALKYRMEAAKAQNDVALRSRSLDQQDAIHRMEMKDRAEQAGERLKVSQATERDRAEQQARNDLQSLSRTTPISAQTMQSYIAHGIAPEHFTPPQGITAPAPPDSIAAPDAPPDQTMPGTVANSPQPMGRMFRRAPTPAEDTADAQDRQQLDLENNPNTPQAMKQFLQLRRILPKGENVPAQAFDGGKPGAIHDTANGLVRIADDNSITPLNVKGYHPAPQPVVIQTGNGQELLDRGKGTTTPIKSADGTAIGPKPSAQTQTRTESAKNVLAHIADVEKEAEQINKLGLMGPVGGRWSDFMAGKIGAGELAAGNPQAAELLGQFRADVGLLKSGMAMVHGGARGGGSPAIIARMDALLNADKMDLPLFKGATTSFKKWLTQYAGENGTGGAAASSGGAAPPAPDGWKYVPKPGGGWTAVKATP